jgi:predicted  nucleic acid-binding Zn-ribbon protein
MKKFILAITAICIMTLLVALNYLLWDNINKENEINALLMYKESVNLNIESLQNENLELRNENSEHVSTITRQTVRINNYENTISSLNKELENANSKIEDRDIVIGFLKKIMNTQMFTDILDAWVTSINQKEYTRAYELQNLRDAFDTKQIINLDKFKSQFANVERIDLKSTEINLSDINRISNQEIAFTAIMNVTKYKTVEEPDTSNIHSRIVRIGVSRKYRSFPAKLDLDIYDFNVLLVHFPKSPPFTLPCPNDRYRFLRLSSIRPDPSSRLRSS